MPLPEVIRHIAPMRARIEAERQAGKRIAFVPTMGALHAGHAELLRVARQHAELVVASIFVNPIQFDRKDDFERYPQTLSRDLEICAAQDTALVFAPSAQEFYPTEPLTFVESPVLSRHLCGAHRPGHFRGVATVVLKLFQAVPAHFACFGEKDAQQLAIIRRMVRDLNLPVEIVAVPTVRESDGFALSSRNQHLTAEEREFAPILSRALRAVRSQLEAGECDREVLLAAGLHVLSAQPGTVSPAESAVPTAAVSLDYRVEYFEVVDADCLQPVDTVTAPVLIAGAIWLGTTRLIDNFTWHPSSASAEHPGEIHVPSPLQ